MAASTLHTDELVSYRAIGAERAAHETVNHSRDEYVRYEGARVITTNTAENFFSQLERSLDGTHHHVSKTHLHRYLAECDFATAPARRTTPSAWPASLVESVAVG